MDDNKQLELGMVIEPVIPQQRNEEQQPERIIITQKPYTVTTEKGTEEPTVVNITRYRSQDDLTTKEPVTVNVFNYQVTEEDDDEAIMLRTVLGAQVEEEADETLCFGYNELGEMEMKVLPNKDQVS